MLFSCVLGSCCQKRAFGGFHGSSFPLLEPQAATGDTLKAQEGKSIHPTHLEPAKPAGPLLDLILLVVICQAQLFQPFSSSEAWKGRGRVSLRRKAGLEPWRRTPVCVEVEGGCEHPSPAVPPSCPRWLRGSAGVTRSRCQCHGHPAPAEHSGKRKHWA